MVVSKNRGTQNGWFIMENLIKMDDLGGPPLFLETLIYGIFKRSLFEGGKSSEDHESYDKNDLSQKLEVRSPTD